MSEIKPIETRMLPVKLTETELLAKGDELARKFHEANTEEDQQKEAKAAMKERFDKLKREARELGEIVRSKREMREVEVIARHDLERHVVETVRVDTNEVVETRMMNADERNLKLFPTLAEEIKEK